MGEQDLLAYLRIIKKRLWIIILLMVVTVGTIVAVFLTAKPVYSATVRFLVTAPPSSNVSLYGEFRQPTMREEINYARANFVEVLRSGTVAWQTVDDLGIAMRGGELLSRVTIKETEGSEFVNLTVTSDTAEEAQLLANTLVQNALRYYGAVRASSVTNSLGFISIQLEQTQREMEEAERRLLQFQIENHMGDLDSEILSVQALIRALRLERDQAEAEDSGDKVASYDRLIAEREIELQDLLLLSTEYAELKAALSRATSLYNLLLDKEAEARLKENEIQNVGFVQIVEPARKPGSPKSPFNAKVVILGAVGSLIVGVLLSFLLEYVERLRLFVPPDEVPVKVSS